jgi:hypothetical protein
MEKNLYWRTAVRRNNFMSFFILDTAFKLASPARILIEVFIRRNFGRRYWSSGMVLFASVCLAIFPVMRYKIGGLSYRGSYDNNLSDFWLHYTTYYLFLLAFLRASWFRWKEVKRFSGVFDVEFFTLYSGDIHPRFFGMHPLGRKPSVRSVEVYYEPGVFFLAGLVLWLLSQPLGMLLMIVSVLYGLSYAAAYKQGNDFIDDKNDEMILNEQYENAFVMGDYNDRRGARYYISRPLPEELRRKMKDQIIDGDDDAAAIAV